MDIPDLRRHLRLCLVLESAMLRLPLGDFIVQSVEGGVSCVQLRDKGAPEGERYRTALELKSLLAGRDVLFIINNSADIAVATGADGVHLGPEDLPPAAVRKLFPGLITGYSCNTIEDVRTAREAGVDYAGVGPVFFTGTKTNLRPVIGIDGLMVLVEGLKIPAVAIGGIDAERAVALKHTGIAGAAVSGALCRSAEPYDTARSLVANCNN